MAQSTGELEGRHVVVAGARGGLGPAVVEIFAAAGAICHLPVREAGAASSSSDPDGVRVVAGIDLANEKSVREFYAGLPSLWASIHVAGGFAGKPLLATTLDDLQGQLDRNLVTAFLCSREAARK